MLRICLFASLLCAPIVAGAQAIPKWHFVESWRKGGAVDGAYAFDGMLTFRAAALAGAPGGRLVVLDPKASRLHILDSAGAVVRSFGRISFASGRTPEGPGS